MRKIFALLCGVVCSASLFAMEYPFDKFGTSMGWMSIVPEAADDFEVKQMESYPVSDFSMSNFAGNWAKSEGDGYKLGINIRAVDGVPSYDTYVKIFHDEKAEMIYFMVRSAGAKGDATNFEVCLAPYIELDGEGLNNPAFRWLRYRELGAGKYAFSGNGEAVKNFGALGVSISYGKIQESTLDMGPEFVCADLSAGDEVKMIISVPFSSFNLSADISSTFYNGSKEFTMDVWNNEDAEGRGISFEPKFNMSATEQYCYSSNDNRVYFSNSWASYLRPAKSTTPIESTDADEAIRIAKDMILFAEPTNAAIFSAAGTVIASYSAVTEITTGSLAPGFYLLQSDLGCKTFVK